MTKSLLSEGSDAAVARITSATALVVDDDQLIAEFFRHSLNDAGFNVSVLHSAVEAMTLVQRRRFALILLDLSLPDGDGLEILRLCSSARKGTRVVVVSGYLTVNLTLEALRIGASDVLEKPVSVDRLINAVTSPRFETAQADILVRLNEADHKRSLAHRWATDIVKGCSSHRDSKTLSAWAKCAGTSTTMICERCGMLDVRPQDARDLMRALFAMLEARQQRCAPHMLLDMADARTLRSFRRRAGPAFEVPHDADAINRFLDSQSFVDPGNYGVTVLRSLLATLRSDGGTFDSHK